MNRLLVVGLAALLVCGGVIAQVWAEDSTAAPTRPNILFCIADDWSSPHAGILGDPVVKTPTFDRVAREGVLFDHAYVVASSCTPSRGAILTGQTIHRLGTGGNLWSYFPEELRVFPDQLEAAEYVIGTERKTWGPGTSPGRKHGNPAGPGFRNFAEFIKTVPADKPFYFWAGTHDPHRPYAKGSGVEAGMDPAKVRVPGWLPDTPEVRSDICYYFVEVQRFDTELGERLALLEQLGRLGNTLVIITGDNGMPFPGAKCTLYDSGARMPFAVMWKDRIKPDRRVQDMISFQDIAPTFLEAAGLDPLPEMTGRSFLNVLLSDRSGLVDPTRTRVFLERERHTVCRPGDQSYPVRAIRTHDYLYLHNLRPDLWPSGDPEAYRDIDGCPTKTEMMERRDEPGIAPQFARAFGRRPAEELYDVRTDPDNFKNLADDPNFEEIKAKLRGEVDAWRKATGDPRSDGEYDLWDRCKYLGGGAKGPRPTDLPGPVGVPK